MYRCCIFDLDGTLLNTIHALTYTTNQVLNRYGLRPVDEAHMKVFVGNGYEKQMERALTYGGDRGLVHLEEAKKIYLEEFEKHCMYQVVPYEGIRETLEFLKERGIAIAVCSNKPHERTQDNIYQIFGETYFSMVLGAKPEIPKKPAPDAPLLIAEALGVKPEECLYVGDTNTDMETGLAASMVTVGAAWGFRSREELESFCPQYVIDSPKELIKIVSKSS